MNDQIREYESDGIEKVEIKVNDHTNIVGTYYDNISADKGIILFPGFTEHRSSLDETARMLNKDFKAWTFDINSQGESTGMWTLKEIQESLYTIQQILKQRHGLKKVGAHGNSIGGMAIGLTATKESDLDCICLTSTPAGLQDIVAPYARTMLSYVPQSLVRFGTILFDKMESRNNENYRKKSHPLFCDESGYKPHAQLGGLKISNLHELIQGITDAPRLDSEVSRITQPTLFIYGGNDTLLGIRQGQLPRQIQSMYQHKVGDKRLIIVEGADHSLNSVTRTDDCFNQDSKYQQVKTEIVNHFAKYLL
jgi:alpha-beta hydrolase superfamily lysophospholipase